MTILSPPRCETPYVLTESGILAPAGMFDRDAVGGGGGGGISLVGFDWMHGGGSPQTLTIPTATAAGDLIIVTRGGRAGDTYTPPAGAGYTELWYHAEGGNAIHQMWYRYAGASEGDTTEDWAYSGLSRGLEIVLLVFTGCVSAGAPEDVTATKNSVYTDTPVCPTITTLTDGCLLLLTYGARIESESDITEDTGYPSGTTGVLRRFDVQDGLGVAWKIAGAAGATGTFTWGAEATETNLHICKTTAIKPS